MIQSKYWKFTKQDTQPITLEQDTFTYMAIYQGKTKEGKTVTEGYIEFDDKRTENECKKLITSSLWDPKTSSGRSRLRKQFTTKGALEFGEFKYLGNRPTLSLPTGVEPVVEITMDEEEEASEDDTVKKRKYNKRS